MPETQIRRAVLVDAEQLAPLHLQVWNEAYAGLMPADVLAQRSASPIAPRIATWQARISGNRVHVAEWAGRLVGWAEAGPGRDPDLPGPELMSLYVVAAIYGSGIGHRLLDAAIGAESAYLWVLDGNARAISFYQRQGFRFDGAAKDDPPYGVERRMVR